MDLKSGYPFWAVKNGLMRPFPQLQRDLQCDIAVVGGGITGALIADQLAGQGFDVAVVEKRDVGWGSTAASTALIQYEIDTHLTDLAKRYGENAAVLAYRACVTAITDLRVLAKGVGSVDFAMQKSLYYASHRRDAPSLRDEFELRRKHGLRVDWLDEEALKATYSLDAPCAILSHVAARLDPYRMAHRLLGRLAKRGGGVFDRTEVDSIAPSARGVELRTTAGARIKCLHLILAAGYESQRWLGRRVSQNRSSYAFVTDPIDRTALGFLGNTLIWESARPYLYLRTTRDGRLVVGGEDDRIDIPARRDRRVESKARKLASKVRRLFPALPVTPAFSWAGTFAESSDGLPYFGPDGRYGPRVQFAMAYGGNGITYSMIGASLLGDRIQRRKHPLGRLFSFERLR
jgi:glycine/D-amino acid oxidase-like deaminating enzyme